MLLYEIREGKKKIEMNIIYEKEEKEINESRNVMAIDVGLNNIVACTNSENGKRKKKYKNTKQIKNGMSIC